MLLSGWKRVISVCLTVILIFTGAGGNGFAVKAKAANKFGSYLYKYNTICGTKKIMLDGEAWGDVKPTGIEIYRSEKKKGNYKKIGNVQSFVRTPEDRCWSFSYKDATVKTGQVYYYKCRAYQKTGNAIKYQKKLNPPAKAIAAKAVGTYTCKLIMSNHEKILFKLTGTKNNGPLKSLNYAFLRYKNKGGKEIKRRVHLTQFSYDGKVWFRGNNIEMKGKESIYLGVEDSPFDDSDGDGNDKENIDVSGYQYIQLLFLPVQYNFSPKNEETPGEEKLRLNFTTGQALTGSFRVHNKSNEWGILWDGDIFDREYGWDEI